MVLGFETLHFLLRSEMMRTDSRDKSAPAKRVLRPPGTQPFSCQHFEERLRLCSSDMYVSLEG